MSHEIKLGQLLSADERRRDAVHVAIMPVVSNEDLKPGQHVGFAPSLNGLGLPTVTAEAKHVGIVDPFLSLEEIKAGQPFWLCMYPGTVTSLRHVWTHPEIPTIRAKETQ